jgi:type IV secretory pathway VirB9-like protein
MSGPPKLTLVPDGVYRLDRPPETTAERVRRRHVEAQMLAREHVGELRAAIGAAVESARQVATGGEAFPAGVRDAAARTLEYLERQVQTLDAILERAPEPKL